MNSAHGYTEGSDDYNRYECEVCPTRERLSSENAALHKELAEAKGHELYNRFMNVVYERNTLQQQNDRYRGALEKIVIRYTVVCKEAGLIAEALPSIEQARAVLSEGEKITETPPQTSEEKSLDA